MKIVYVNNSGYSVVVENNIVVFTDMVYKFPVGSPVSEAQLNEKGFKKHHYIGTETNN